jgi:hypothetical protein
LVELHLPGHFLILAHLLLAFHVPPDDLLQDLFLLVKLVRGHGHAVALQHPQEVLGGHLSIGVHLVKEVLRQGWCLVTSEVLAVLLGCTVLFYSFENGVVFFFLLVLLLLVLMVFGDFVD